MLQVKEKTEWMMVMLYLKRDQDLVALKILFHPFEETFVFTTRIRDEVFG